MCLQAVFSHREAYLLKTRAASAPPSRENPRREPERAQTGVAKQQGAEEDQQIDDREAEELLSQPDSCPLLSLHLECVFSSPRRPSATAKRSPLIADRSVNPAADRGGERRKGRERQALGRRARFADGSPPRPPPRANIGTPTRRIIIVAKQCASAQECGGVHKEDNRKQNTGFKRDLAPRTPPSRSSAERPRLRRQ